MLAANGQGSGPYGARLRRLALLLLFASLAFWLFGAVLFLRADGSVSYTLPRRVEPPVGEHNLASYRYGPHLRASSYFRDPVAHHHPMFLVDGLRLPSLLEKWVCAPDDRKPWFSVAWREPRTLTRVRIQHAGMREAAELSAASYRLRCLTEAGEGAELEVEGNRQSISEHPLSCADARGLRIDFHREQGDDVVRVFEVEAWGR